MKPVSEQVSFQILGAPPQSAQKLKFAFGNVLIGWRRRESCRIMWQAFQDGDPVYEINSRSGHLNGHTAASQSFLVLSGLHIQWALHIQTVFCRIYDETSMS